MDWDGARGGQDAGTTEIHNVASTAAVSSVTASTTLMSPLPWVGVLTSSAPSSAGPSVGEDGSGNTEPDNAEVVPATGSTVSVSASPDLGPGMLRSLPWSAVGLVAISVMSGAAAMVGSAVTVVYAAPGSER